MSNKELNLVIDRAEDEYQKLKDKVIEQGLEIERLDNIINEFEKWLKEKNKFYEISTMGYSYGVIKEVIDKLQELKGSESNE